MASLTEQAGLQDVEQRPSRRVADRWGPLAPGHKPRLYRAHPALPTWILGPSLTPLDSISRGPLRPQRPPQDAFDCVPVQSGHQVDHEVQRRLVVVEMHERDMAVDVAHRHA